MSSFLLTAHNQVKKIGGSRLLPLSPESIIINYLLINRHGAVEVITVPITYRPFSVTKKRTVNKALSPLKRCFCNINVRSGATFFCPLLYLYICTISGILICICCLLICKYQQYHHCTYRAGSNVKCRSCYRYGQTSSCLCRCC